MCSRPRRSPRTRPALESTSRCFLIAWRETADSALRCVIDSGPLAASRTSRRNRVSSPSAAKSGAASLTCAAAITLASDMALDVLQLLGPSLAVHAERLGATFGRNAIEAGFDYGEQRALRHLFEPELDERRGLLRVVDLRVDRSRVPTEREELLGVHPLDGDGEPQVLVAGVGDIPCHVLADGEVRFQLDPEPGAELFGVGERAPDARLRCAEQDVLFDAVCVGH